MALVLIMSRENLDRAVRRQFELARTNLAAAQFLAIELLRHPPYQFSEDFTVELPTGSGKQASSSK